MLYVAAMTRPQKACALLYLNRFIPFPPLLNAGLMIAMALRYQALQQPDNTPHRLIPSCHSISSMVQWAMVPASETPALLNT